MIAAIEILKIWYFLLLQYSLSNGNRPITSCQYKIVVGLYEDMKTT